MLSLSSIRASLIRQEETIIFALVERSQFRQNPVIYGPDMVPPALPPGCTLPGPSSFLEYMLMGTEAVHSSVRRYTSPEEHSFFPRSLPPPLPSLTTLTYPPNLLSPAGGAADFSVNPPLLALYIDTVIPRVSLPGDDEQHGSSVLADVAALQAVSKRVSRAPARGESGCGPRDRPPPPL